MFKLQALIREHEEELATLKHEKAEKSARLRRAAGSLSREETTALENETRMLHRRIFPLEKQVLMDREETQAMALERGRWLVTALQAYRRCLEAGTHASADQRVVFRVIAIWFEICGGVDAFASQRKRLSRDHFGVANAADDAALLRTSTTKYPSSRRVPPSRARSSWT